jgi:hypothetical protein
MPGYAYGWWKDPPKYVGDDPRNYVLSVEELKQYEEVLAQQATAVSGAAGQGAHYTQGNGEEARTVVGERCSASDLAVFGTGASGAFGQGGFGADEVLTRVH